MLYSEWVYDLPALYVRSLGNVSEEFAEWLAP